MPLPLPASPASYVRCVRSRRCEARCSAPSVQMMTRRCATWAERKAEGLRCSNAAVFRVDGHSVCGVHAAVLQRGRKVLYVEGV